MNPIPQLNMTSRSVQAAQEPSQPGKEVRCSIPERLACLVNHLMRVPRIPSINMSQKYSSSQNHSEFKSTANRPVISRYGMTAPARDVHRPMAAPIDELGRGSRTKIPSTHEMARRCMFQRRLSPSRRHFCSLLGTTLYSLAFPTSTVNQLLLFVHKALTYAKYG
jgi:hypothetical protein